MKTFISKHIIPILLTLCCLLAACSTEMHGNTISSSADIFTVAPPEFELVVEVNSCNVTAEASQPQYSANEQIDIIVTGSNTAGNALYYYEFLALERLQEDGWHQVPYLLEGMEPIAYDEGYLWSYGFREDSDVMWTTLTFQSDRFSEQLSPGEYRALVFLPDTQVYAYFEIVE